VIRPAPQADVTRKKTGRFRPCKSGASGYAQSAEQPCHIRQNQQQRGSENDKSRLTYFRMLEHGVCLLFVIPERQKLTGFIRKKKRAAGKGEVKRAGTRAKRPQAWALEGESLLCALLLLT
jgi:hypothetical protein